MKKTKTNIPELRFPGFEGEWEEKKLGDGIKELQAGVSVNSIDTPVCIGECGILKTSAVYNGKFDVAKNKRIIEEDLDKAKISPIPDNIIISRMNTPDLVGECGYVLNPSENIFLPDRLWITSGVNRSLFNVKFINYTLNTPQNKLVIKNKATGTSNSMKNITKQDWLLTTIALPIISEQEKIAKFLEAVDQKIEQLEKMVVLHEKYKKGMMQRIFNQEIRFKSSNGTPLPAWQQKKLGDVGAFISTNSFSRDKLNYERGSIYNIHYGDIHTKFRHLFSQERENVPFINESEIVAVKDEKLFCKEFDIIIADASEDYCDIGKTIEVVDTKQNKIMAGLHTLHFRPSIKFAKGFNAFQFQSSFIREQIQRFAQGISVLGISKANLQKLVINYPALEEQEKIAGFLSALDEKIEQSKAELEKAKNWKKGLMQRLFV